MSVARRPRPTPARRGLDPDHARRPTRRGLDRHRSSLGSRFGAWRRTRFAHVPTGPILLVVAATLALASLRLAPAELGTDPAVAQPVVVAVVELGAGTIIDPDDIEVRTYPSVAVPATAVTEVSEVVGRQVVTPILAGEPVVSARLAPDGLVGVAAATPPSWSAFALPADAALPGSAVGQDVDLYALDATTQLPSSDPEARRIARSARVVAVDDGQVTVAVRDDDAPGLAAALIGATVVVAVTGPVTPAADDARGP